MDLSKLVIGKPATASDASNGCMDPDTLATCLGTAKDQGWGKSFDPIFAESDSLSAAERKDGGAMVWQVCVILADHIETILTKTFRRR